MRITYLIIAILLTFSGSFSRAATLCVQDKKSGAYEAVNKPGDCGTQEPKKLREPEMGYVKEFSQKPEVISPQVEAISISPPTDAQAIWDLRAEDGSIYAAIKRWASVAGWQVSWEIPVDFPIEISDSSTGSFESSVRRVLTALRVSDYPPYPCFHENKVVRVVRRIQGNDDECKQ